jgi:benzoylformate decarboxylase
MQMNGAEVFCETLANSGVEYLFGNPGSTELPLMDALAAGARLDYRLALHEIPAMAMADGYAQATGRPAVVNVHVACGVGNSLGMLYNAWCAGTPLVLTAGQQDRRLLFEEPVLAGDLLGVTRPWTKWSAEVHRVEDVAAAARRALKEAATPPTGPVFLSLPVDLQSEMVEDADTRPAEPPPRGTRPPADTIALAAKTLLEAESPVVLAGARVTEAGACTEIEELARKLGAPVFSDSHASVGRLPVRPDSELYAGALPLWSADLRQGLDGHDAAVVVGMPFPRLYVYQEPACPLPPETKVIQIDCNPSEIGKTLPVTAGLAGDIRATLTGLIRAIAAEANWEHARRAVERCDRMRKTASARKDAFLTKLQQTQDARPMQPETLIGALAAVMPADAAFVEEAPTTNRNLLAQLGHPRDPAAHFAHRGWALGWGLGCAIGVKQAWPNRPVVALLGDGAALYGIQGLWTAAHYGLPVVFLVANNAEYKILKDVGAVMGLPESQAGRHVGLDLTDPRIDFVKLAESFGVQAVRAETPGEVSQAVSGGFSSGAPLLVEAPIAAKQS